MNKLASNSLHLIKFELQEDYSIDKLVDLIFVEKAQDEDWFLLEEACGSIIDGYYISYYNSKEIIYNTENALLETVLVRKNSIVPFSINLENCILDIWGNKSNVVNLTSEIGILLNHNIKMDYININLEKIASNLKDTSIRIGKIKIDNYPLEKDIIAQCTLDLKNYGNSKTIVEKYSKDLVQISLIIYSDTEESLTMMIYKSGSVVVYKSKDDISQETLDLIRKICIV